MRIGLQAKLERRVFVEQELGQLFPDGGVGQRLHVAVAQLRAIAHAGAHAGVRSLVDDGDFVSRLLQLIRRCQTHNTCAENANVHSHPLKTLKYRRLYCR